MTPDTTECAPSTSLPAKGIWVELGSASKGGDALFDVQLTSNCIGAAVLLYTTARVVNPEVSGRLAEALGAPLIQPFGTGIGLCHIEAEHLGKAVVQLGSCELRLTLLLGVLLTCREQFETALFAAFNAAPGHVEKDDLLQEPQMHAEPKTVLRKECL